MPARYAVFATRQGGSRKLLWLAVLAACAAPARSQPTRTMVVRQIAGADQNTAAELTRILSWGSRDWEPLLATPLTVEQRDPGGRILRTFYFALEAADYLEQAPHLPTWRSEKTVAEAVDRALHDEGPAPWPVYVFSGPTRLKATLDAVSLASTLRIFVHDENGGFEPATAIVLNSVYWKTPDESAPANDRFSSLVARHELYHARRAWLRAAETTAHADAIETMLRESGDAPVGRIELESLVSRAMMAWEEVSAIDRSLGYAAITSSHRQSILEYRERNIVIQNKIIAALAGMFRSVQDHAGRKAVEKTLTDLLRRDLRPPRPLP